MSETATRQGDEPAAATATPAAPVVRQVRVAPAPGTPESPPPTLSPPPKARAAHAGEAADAPVLARWLENACAMIPGVGRAWAELDATPSSPERVAAWPDGNDRHARSRLAGLLQRARAAGEALIQSVPAVAPDAPSLTQVACPLERGGAVAGYIAVECAGLNPAQHEAVLSLLRWSGRWLELLGPAGGPAPGQPEGLFHAVGEAFEHADDGAVALALTTHLAHRLDLERVSLGRIGRGVASVLAVSDTPEIALRGEYGTLLARAMKEAAGSETPILHRAAAEAVAAPASAHAALASATGCGDVLSIALRRDGRCFAVLGFEARRGRPMDEALAGACRCAAEALAPALALKLARPGVASRLLGGAASHRTRLALLGLAGAALLGFGLGDGQYRLLAEATVEGRVQRAVVTPFEGFVAEARVRPGDPVKAGDVLATLQGSELELERRRVLGDRDELRKQHRRALVGGERAEVQVLEARIEQASARVEFVEARLARTRLLAPIDGVVISGDLSRALGAPVERGQVLFEIAPLHEHRIAVDVDERDIRWVSPGQPGTLRLSALPGDPLPVVVERVTSVASVAGGRNTFRVEARLAGEPAPLRPGMQGTLRLEVDSRARVWLLTHRLVDWLRLTWWAWSP